MIDGEGGDDQIVILATESNTTTSIDGGPQDDLITFSPNDRNLSAIAGDVVVDGGDHGSAVRTFAVGFTTSPRFPNNPKECNLDPAVVDETRTFGDTIRFFDNAFVGQGSVYTFQATTAGTDLTVKAADPMKTRTVGRITIDGTETVELYGSPQSDIFEVNYPELNDKPLPDLIQIYGGGTDNYLALMGSSQGDRMFVGNIGGVLSPDNSKVLRTQIEVDALPNSGLVFSKMSFRGLGGDDQMQNLTKTPVIMEGDEGKDIMVNGRVLQISTVPYRADVIDGAPNSVFLGGADADKIFSGGADGWYLPDHRIDRTGSMLTLVAVQSDGDVVDFGKGGPGTVISLGKDCLTTSCGRGVVIVLNDVPHVDVCAWLYARFIFGTPSGTTPQEVPPGGVLQINALLKRPEGEATFRNLFSPLDVNADGVVTPLDVMYVISILTQRPEGEGGSFSGDTSVLADVNGDGEVTPLDALTIIEALTDGVAGEGEASLESQGVLLSNVGTGRSQALVVNQPASVVRFSNAVADWLAEQGISNSDRIGQATRNLIGDLFRRAQDARVRAEALEDWLHEESELDWFDREF